MQARGAVSPDPGPEDDLLGKCVGEYDGTQAGIRPADAFEDHAQGAYPLPDTAQVFGQRYAEESEFVGLGQDGIVKGTERIPIAHLPAMCQLLACKIQGKILKGLHFVMQ